MKKLIRECLVVWIGTAIAIEGVKGLLVFTGSTAGLTFWDITVIIIVVTTATVRGVGIDIATTTGDMVAIIGGTGW